MSTRTNPMGRRLVIFYGPTGSGKTHTAKMEYPAAKTIPAWEVKTSTVFLDRGLREAMKKGEAVILEDVELLCEECLDLLLKVCDGRMEYSESGSQIPIKDGFRVVATSRFWDGDAKFSGYDRRIALLLELVAGAETRECYNTPATIAVTAGVYYKKHHSAE